MVLADHPASPCISNDMISAQIDSLMDTDVTSEEVRSLVVKDTAMQIIDEYIIYQECMQEM